MNWDAQRARMVDEQILRRGIADPRLLDALRKIPRHLFIPESQRAHAYEDRALGVGHGQTISQPYMVALMLNALALEGTEKVLEVGTGSGYQAALLSQLAAEVHTVEIISELAIQAQALLGAYSNVHVHTADGARGWPERAPYDAILVAAATPRVQAAWKEQLTKKGKLILPLGSGARETLTLLERRSEEFREERLGECSFVPLTGEAG